MCMCDIFFWDDALHVYSIFLYLPILVSLNGKTMMKGLQFANIPEQSELSRRSGRTSGLESIGMNRFRSVAELSFLAHPKRTQKFIFICWRNCGHR